MTQQQNFPKQLINDKGKEDENPLLNIFVNVLLPIVALINSARVVINFGI